MNGTRRPRPSASLWSALALAALVARPAHAELYSGPPSGSRTWDPLMPTRIAASDGAGVEARPELDVAPGAMLALPAVDWADGTKLAARRERPPERRRGRSMLGSRDAMKALITPERARVLLQSLTVPGWGQATAGANRSSAAFLVAEAGVWGSFTAFRIQQQLRRQSYEKTARLFAGIDLRGRDEEFRRIVGSFLSSDDYNRLVVRRDAANLHYGDQAAYNEYIAEHELKGADAWSWGDVESLLRYVDQRKDTQKAGLRANTALALAVANRIVSAIHAARVSRPATPTTTSWQLECVPAGDGDPTAFHVGVRTRF